MQLLATFLAADPWIIRWAALVNECETERDEENASERMIAPRCDVKAGTTQVRAGEPRRRAKRSKAMRRGSEEAKKRRRRRLEEATSRAQPRPVCNLPNDLQHSGINNHGRSESYETVRCGGILFKNNCVPSCDGFLCLITANCSEFTSIMARLTRRLCNGRECIRKRERERVESSCRPAGNCNSCVCSLAKWRTRSSWRESTSFRVSTGTPYRISDQPLFLFSSLLLSKPRYRR